MAARGGLGLMAVGLTVGVAQALVAGPAAATSAVTFDHGFGGGDGVRIIQPALSASIIHVKDMAVALDGTIWVVGSAQLPAGFDMFTCRMDADGGAHSCVVFGFNLGGGGNQDFATAIALDVMGGPVVVGTATGTAGDPETRLAVAKLTPAGLLDTSWGGGDGKVDLPLTGPVDVSDVQVMSDGRIVVAGSIDQSGSGGSVDILVGRLSAAGAWDSSFDGDGRRIVAMDLGGSDAERAAGLALEPSGWMTVAATVTTGASSTEIWALRLTVDGAFDGSFDGDGRAEVVLTGSALRFASGVVKDRRGRVVVAGFEQGTVPDRVVLGRFLPTGSPDLEFGIAGVTRIAVEDTSVIGAVGPVMTPGPANAAMVLGRYLTGVPADAADTYTLRVDPLGDPDSGWGSGSGVETQSTIPSVASVEAYFTAATFQQSRLIAVGTAGAVNNYGFVARLQVDELFADDFESGNTNAWSVVVGDGGGPSLAAARRR